MTPTEELAFTEFVRSHGDRLLRLARLLVPNTADAEDLLQAALLRLARHWSRGLVSPQGYVRIALVNLAKDRGRRRHLVAVPVESDPGVTVGVDHADAIASRAQLDQLLAALPPRQRITVVLRVLDGLSEAETAQAMGCAPGTVKSNLSRGLDKIRTALGTMDTSTEKAAR